MPMVLRSSSKYRPFYSCSMFPDCRETHGAHPDGRPLGIPATHETKQLRIEAHKVLDEYRAALKLSRNQTYAALCRLMEVTREEGHIGRFDSSSCRLLISRLRADLAAKAKDSDV